MTSEEFKTLKIGDMVEIIVHGKNKGKRGIVRSFKYDSLSEPRLAYIESYRCEFQFYEGRGLYNEDGLPSWNNRGIKRVNNQELSIVAYDPVDPNTITDSTGIVLDLNIYDVQMHTENNKLIINWQPKMKGDK